MHLDKVEITCSELWGRVCEIPWSQDSRTPPDNQSKARVSDSWRFLCHAIFWTEWVKENAWVFFLPATSVQNMSVIFCTSLQTGLKGTLKVEPCSCRASTNRTNVPTSHVRNDVKLSWFQQYSKDQIITPGSCLKHPDTQCWLMKFHRINFHIWGSRGQLLIVISISKEYRVASVLLLPTHWMGTLFGKHNSVNIESTKKNASSHNGLTIIETWSLHIWREQTNQKSAKVIHVWTANTDENAARMAGFGWLDQLIKKHGIKSDLVAACLLKKPYSRSNCLWKTCDWTRPNGNETKLGWSWIVGSQRTLFLSGCFKKWFSFSCVP